MKNTLKYLKTFGIFMSYLLISNFFISLLYLYTNLSKNTCNIITFIFVLLIFIIIGFKYGHQSNNKGYKSGLKIGSILVLTLFIISLFFKYFFSLSKVIYYLVLILGSTLASVLGINTKKGA